MIILILNCGSSSIKYQLFDMGKDADVIAKGMVERIGFTDAVLSHKPKGKNKYNDGNQFGYMNTARNVS